MTLLIERRLRGFQTVPAEDCAAHECKVRVLKSARTIEYQIARGAGYQVAVEHFQIEELGTDHRHADAALRSYGEIVTTIKAQKTVRDRAVKPHASGTWSLHFLNQGESFYDRPIVMVWINAVSLRQSEKREARIRDTARTSTLGGTDPSEPKGADTGSWRIINQRAATQADSLLS